MDATSHLEKDPVCEMMVDPRANYAEYRGVGYAFCSQQCRERFTAGPGLYVGRRGRPAPKQRGVAVIKRRRMVLGSPLTPARFAELTGVLQSMMGVTALRPVDYADERVCDALRPEGGTPMTIGVEALEVTYDLLQVTAEQIERELSELDVALSDKWGEKLQRDFVRYLERCELGDLEIRDVRSVTFGARRRQPRASYTAWKRAGTAYR